MIIRTELLAHDTNQNTNLDINTLLKVEKLLEHLEGKGKKSNTIDSFCRHINKCLSKHADFDNPQEVELTIARLKLTDPKTFSPS